MGPALAVYHDEREILYGLLLDNAVGHANDHTLAQIYATWATGGGALPDWLGLVPTTFRDLMEFHFPGFAVAHPPNPGRALASERFPELDDLRQLLLEHRSAADPSTEWVAEIVTVACMAQEHLWRDLGVWSRRDLSQLMYRNFPDLAARNVRDMKWKKFLYKQMCEAEGIYVCRAPSCDACTDYDRCFGPED